MPGQAGLCKNKNCWNDRTQSRKQAQSGLGGYCRSCAKIFAAPLVDKARLSANEQRLSSLHDCYYCGRSEPEPIKRQCCNHRAVRMCNACFAMHDKAVCHICYKDWHHTCFRCRAALPADARKYRYCEECYPAAPQPAIAEVCYYCRDPHPSTY